MLRRPRQGRQEQHGTASSGEPQPEAGRESLPGSPAPPARPGPRESAQRYRHRAQGTAPPSPWRLLSPPRGTEARWRPLRPSRWRRPREGGARKGRQSPAACARPGPSEGSETQPGDSAALLPARQGRLGRGSCLRSSFKPSRAS